MKYLVLCAILALSGCGKIQIYELESIVEQCGAVQKIRSVWLDVTTAKARCDDGRLVKAK